MNICYELEYFIILDNNAIIILVCVKVIKYTKGCGDHTVSVRKRKLVQAGAQAGVQAGTNVEKRHDTSRFTGREGRGMYICRSTDRA